MREQPDTKLFTAVYYRPEWVQYGAKFIHGCGSFGSKSFKCVGLTFGKASQMIWDTENKCFLFKEMQNFCHMLFILWFILCFVFLHVRLSCFFLSMAWFDVTFAGTVGPAEHCALLYAAERLKHLPHIGVCLLFSQHAHKQLPVF